MKSKSFIIAALLGAAGIATLWAMTVLNSLSLSLAMRAAFGESVEVFTPAILLFIFMLMAGCVFVWLKVNLPLQVALAGSSVALLLYIAISQKVNLPSVGVWAVWLFIFVAAGLSFAAGIWATKFVKKAWVAWIVAAGLGVSMVIAQAVVPPAPTVAQSTQAMAERDAGFARAVSNLNFSVQQPTYVPDGLTLGKPELWGYDPALAGQVNPYAAYTVGPIMVQQSKTLPNQDKIVNLNDVCDLEGLWASMASTAQITDEHTTLAKTKSSPCTLAATTPGGKKIYVSEKQQAAYVYISVDGTDVMFKFDAAKKKYTAGFLPEVSKMVDSLAKIELTSLQQGQY
jgi:hypothetical protein